MIDSILKEPRMMRTDFKEVKAIAKEMRESGKIEIMTLTPIVVVMPEVTVAQTSVQAPSVPYVVVAQEKPPRREKETIAKPVERRSPKHRASQTYQSEEKGKENN